jgi:hypothetical protein
LSTAALKYLTKTVQLRHGILVISGFVRTLKSFPPSYISRHFKEFQEFQEFLQKCPARS